MRILFALPYSPGVTRVRSRMILDRLCRRHEVTLVGLTWDESDRDVLASWSDRVRNVYAIPHGRRQQLLGFAGSPFRPLQQMVSTSPAFAGRVRRLVQQGIDSGFPFDAIHVEHLRGAAAANLFDGLNARVVYDAVDCLSMLAAQTREHGVSRPVRLIAGLECRRTREAEDRLLKIADMVTVVAERDRRAMIRDREIDNLLVVPNGVERSAAGLDELPGAARAVFTGKLSYHANQAALKWLLDDVWSRVRQAVPDATLTIAGADPPDWIRQAAGRSGVELVANPDNMDAVIRRARVAVAPVIYSAGIQNKVLEAMAAARPVVATSCTVDGLEPASRATLARAGTSREFASELVRLFRDDYYAETLRRRGYQYVLRHHDWDTVVQTFEELYSARELPAKVA